MWVVHPNSGIRRQLGPCSSHFLGLDYLQSVLGLPFWSFFGDSYTSLSVANFGPTLFSISTKRHSKDTESFPVGGWWHLTSKSVCDLGGSRSSWFLDGKVSDRLSTMHSTSVNRVLKDSSSRVSLCSSIKADKIDLTDRIWRSHLPPIWDAAGEFCFHWIIQSALKSLQRLLWTVLWSAHLGIFFSSLSTPTMLVPWSDLIWYHKLALSLLRIVVGC